MITRVAARRSHRQITDSGMIKKQQWGIGRPARNDICLQARTGWDHKRENEEAKMPWDLKLQTDECLPHPGLIIVDKEGKNIWMVDMATPGGRRRKGALRANLQCLEPHFENHWH